LAEEEEEFGMRVRNLRISVQFR